MHAQDFRFAVRTLGKAPAFTALAVSLIALTIGLNTALFGFLYASVLKPLPYDQPDSLVHVVEMERGRRVAPLTPHNFATVRRESTSFVGVTGYRSQELELSDVEPPRRVLGLHVLHGFFEVAGVMPTIGRSFAGNDFYATASSRDGLWSVADVVILGHGFWQRELGGSSDVVGETLRLNDKSVTVIGVMPDGFDALWRDVDFYLPWIAPPDFWTTRPPHVLPMLARLAPGATVESASDELTAIYAGLAREYPDTNEVLTAAVEPLREQFKSSTRTLAVLFAGALMVLLVACANLAGLIAGRTRSRLREVAVRRALGASTLRITSQLMTESALVALAGGVVGVGLAYAALDVATPPMALPFAPELSVPVLAATAAFMAMTVLCLGLTPAWLVSGSDLSTSLRGRVESLSPRRLAGVFVVMQLAVALGLISAGGLLLQSLTVLEREELGFDPRGIQSFYVSLPDTRYPDESSQRLFRRRLVEELRALASVTAADTASHLPTTPMTLNLATAIEGRLAPRGSYRAAPIFVSHDLLRTLAIPILRGRGFDEGDTQNSPWVIVINERMAEHFWPNEDAVGRRVRLEYAWAPDAAMTVIGVVPDVRQEGVGRDVRPAFYILHEQFPQSWFYAAIRTEDSRNIGVSTIRSRVAAVDPNLPLTNVMTMSERVDRSLSEHRTRAGLVSLYASAALALATFGLYVALASLVGQRARELVIRMAIGATVGDIVRLVLADGLRHIGAGIALGLVIAWGGRRFVESFLYGVEASDGLSLVGAASILALAGVAAALAPALRAARLELTSRLRED